MRMISTIDLSYENQAIKYDFMNDFEKLYDSNLLMIGPAIDDLEKQLAEYCGTKYCSLTGSGTMALQVAAKALGIGPGDEVIVPANTFIGSAVALYNAGAKIVLADVDASTLNISPKTAQRVITPKTKAICLVHLYGNLVNTEDYSSFGLPIIEDASHAFGGLIGNRRCGNLGDIAGFSAGPIKAFGGLGHAGFITYNQPSFHPYIQAFINNGQIKRHYAQYVGHNFRIDSINALFLQKKLLNWEHFLERRKSVMKIYDTFFDMACIKRQSRDPKSDSALWVYVIRVDKKIRDKVIHYLREKASINALVQYSYTINQLPIWKEISARPTKTPISEKLSNEIISLPIHPGITAKDATYICRKIVEAIEACS